MREYHDEFCPSHEKFNYTSDVCQCSLIEKVREQEFNYRVDDAKMTGTIAVQFLLEKLNEIALCDNRHGLGVSDRSRE